MSPYPQSSGTAQTQFHHLTIWYKQGSKMMIQIVSCLFPPFCGLETSLILIKVTCKWSWPMEHTELPLLPHLPSMPLSPWRAEQHSPKNHTIRGYCKWITAVQNTDGGLNAGAMLYMQVGKLPRQGWFVHVFIGGWPSFLLAHVFSTLLQRQAIQS